MELKDDIVFEAALCGQSLSFHTTWGLFSPRQIDAGSRLLLEQLDQADFALALDLGCGYGALGLTLAKRMPGASVHLVDKDFLAVEYAQKNARLNGLTNTEIYLSHAFREVETDGFDLMVANLPANVGKELLTIMLTDARERLRPGGALWVVTIAGLRQFIKRNCGEIFGNYAKVKQGKDHTVAMARR